MKCRWTATDIIVVIFSITLCLSLLISGLGPLILGKPLSDIRSGILAGIAGSIITIIAMYVKDKLKNYNDDNDADKRKQNDKENDNAQN